MPAPSLVAFLGAGLARASGSRRIAGRVAAAALAAGLAASPLLASPASAAGSARFELAPLLSGPAASPAEAGPSLEPATMRKLIEGAQPFVDAALRHGLDPDRFLTIALVVRDLRDDGEAARLRLAPVRAGKPGPDRPAEAGTARWLDLVARHGRGVEGGAAALDALDRAQALEAGRRRKPLVESVMRRIVEMRDDPAFHAEILAREYVALRDGMPAGFDLIPESHAYIALAYGAERLFEIARAAEEPLRPGAPAAHRILGVGAGSNALLTAGGADAGSKGDGKGDAKAAAPIGAAAFIQEIEREVARMRAIARAVGERTTADASPAPGMMGAA